VPTTYDLSEYVYQSGFRVILRCRRRQGSSCLLLAAPLCLGLPSAFGRRQRLFRPRLAVTPRVAGTPHRPRPHPDLAPQGDAGLLRGGVTAAGESLVDATRPTVVTHHAPGALHQQLAQQGRTTLGDAATTV